jgi:nucleotide-binding universal stress UspA family protein
MHTLIVTNGSPHAVATLQLGAHFSQSSPGVEPPTILTVIRSEGDRSKAEALLAHARKQLSLPNAQTIIRIGQPAEQIIREASQGAYDLIVVGYGQRADTHSSVARLVAGSTAQRVAERAPCPVLLAKDQATSIRRILLCVSGVEGMSAELGIRATGPALGLFAARLADFLDGEEEITLLHVMSQISAGPGVPGRQLRAGVDELMAERSPEGEFLRQDLQILERPRVRVYPKIRHGLVLEEILDEARSMDYDLVVIGAHPGGGWQHLLLDDLAKKLIAQLNRSVLVVR